MDRMNIKGARMPSKVVSELLEILGLEIHGIRLYFLGIFQVRLMQNLQIPLFDLIWDIEMIGMWLIETDRRLDILNDETFTLKLNPAFYSWGRLYWISLNFDFQHPLVAAPFGRASAVLRGTVWYGSSAS